MADAKVSKTFGITSRVGSIPTIPIPWICLDSLVTGNRSSSAATRKKAEVTFEVIPRSLISEVTLTLCLKCAFDFFTRQLKLAPRTAYTELKKHVPEESDFTGASTSRPHFFESPDVDHCPYCSGAKRWFARFKATRIDSHPSIEKERKKLWSALKKDSERFVLWTHASTPRDIFSEWLDRLKRRSNLDTDDWLRPVAIDAIQRSHPSADLDTAIVAGVERIQISRQLAAGWNFEDHWLYVGPEGYGDALLVQYLISRSHLHGGRTLEGRLTLQELMSRLKRVGYFEARGIEFSDLYQMLEQAVDKLVASGPTAVYYAVDRSDYLKQLKTVYDKKREK